MDSYTLIYKSVIEKLQSGKSVENIIENIVESANKEFNYEVDFGFLNDEIKELNQLRFDTYNYLNSDELESALQNTLADFNIDTSNKILVSALRLLSKSDKLILIDDTPYCVKIISLLIMVTEYKNAIIEYKELKSLSVLERGIALWVNSDISQCINPRIESLNSALYLTNNNVSIILSKNLLLEFKEDAYKMDFALHALNNISKEHIDFSIINEHAFDIVRNNRKFLNASHPLNEEDFFKSAQISILSLYKKYNFIDSIMNFKTKLSQEKILKSINTIMEHMLDMPQSNLYNACFTKPVQIRTYFFDTVIYEYRTKENIKLNPIFENEQEFKTISRLIS